ncbi:MAG: hypothetical protein H7839_05005 [Magnetococcus sp. YQC-5]
MSNQTSDWYCGPGRYFWTSDARLADLELGYCATGDELAQALRDMNRAGREEMELGGCAYRVQGIVTRLQDKTPFPVQTIVHHHQSKHVTLKRSA